MERLCYILFVGFLFVAILIPLAAWFTIASWQMMLKGIGVL